MNFNRRLIRNAHLVDVDNLYGGYYIDILKTIAFQMLLGCEKVYMYRNGNNYDKCRRIEHLLVFLRWRENIPR